MKFSYTLDALIDLLRPKNVIGRCDDVICGIASLVDAKRGDLSFLWNLKYKKDLLRTEASVVLIPADYPAEEKDGRCFLLFHNPSLAFGVLCGDIERKFFPKPRSGIHAAAVVDDGATLGKNVSVGAHVVIERDAIIGDDVTIMAGCYIGCGVRIGNGAVLHQSVKVLHDCEIGKRSVLFPGVVIGSDGFGYEQTENAHERMPQIGNVIIGDDVDIGANSTIDRARFGHTTVGNGTKIDNLVQIGHNVTIGSKCILVSQVGIAGSTAIGNNVIVGGQAGIAGHLHIPDGVQVAAKCGIASYKPKMGKILRGNPAMPIGEIMRFYALRPKLHSLFQRVAALEKIVNA
ncbi:MAG: UDP-3-O-(3-hydroxymyristoyl)glucosamine N-acyltransferase [Puniceicoccales bacterium]|jgi:UDP-3-O-[3-hydroxymyristoyl] glucosamine N-acyltransferase|nr:UDP-3-O-(3-hydroxymyristoyl)glucosamine N-acyltransferase [Puniceicoccales bacterium]